MMNEPEVSDLRPSTDVAGDPSAQVAALATSVLSAGGDRSAATLPVWPSRPRRGWRGWLALAGVLAVWCVTLVLGVVALLRIFYHDGSYLLICINAFTMYVYLPAYAVLAWAAWRRRWWLAAASVLIVACHLMWVGPDFLPGARSSPPPPGAAAASPTMRIFFANVLVTNSESQALLDEIAAANPDVIVLVEFSPKWEQAFRHAPSLAPYKYRPARISRGQIACYSRLPITSVENVVVTNRICRLLTVRLGDDAVRLFCLHGPRPMDYPWFDHTGYWKLVLPLIARQPEPLVVVGDFNSTQHSSVYEELTAGRLRSAHADRGRGYATTWPNGRRWLPPIRIDQALISGDVECLGIAEGRGAGSDHRPVILDVCIRHDGAAAPTGTSAAGVATSSEPVRQSVRDHAEGSSQSATNGSP